MRAEHLVLILRNYSNHSLTEKLNTHLDGHLQKVQV